MYTDNYGVKQIGKPFDVSKSITITDDMISGIKTDTYTYNKLEYSKYNIKKNSFTGTDNDLAENQDQDNEEYDEALTINIYSNVDIDLDIILNRESEGISYTVSNFFGSESSTTPLTPESYSAFDIDLGGIFEGITLYVNFFGLDLEVGKTFRGSLQKRELTISMIKDSIDSSEKKLIWKNDKTLGLKFPFLYQKYSVEFGNVVTPYFKYGNKIRKQIEVQVQFDDLMLFNTSYNIFNIGEQLVVIDSKEKYLNGFYLDDRGFGPFNNNKATFYIEKIIYNFNQKTTIFKLVSI